MDLIIKNIIALVQGIGEFLPISSSGHIELIEQIFSVNYGLEFSVLLHLATVCSIFVVYRKDFLNLFIDITKKKSKSQSKFFMQILLAEVPIAIFSLFFWDNIKEMFNSNILYLKIGFFITLVLQFLLLELFSKKPKAEKNLDFKSAFLIGLAQLFAIVPGISRSGSTIVAGKLLNINFEDNVRFSFFISIIPIVGANLLDFLKSPKVFLDLLNTFTILSFLICFLVGIITIKLIKNFNKKVLFSFSTVYLLLLNIFLLFYF